MLLPLVHSHGEPPPPPPPLLHHKSEHWTDTTPPFSYSLSSVQASGVKECVVMESYIALVFFDGRVCRVRYQEEPPAPASTSAAATAKDKRWREGGEGGREGGKVKLIFCLVCVSYMCFA